MTGPIAHERHRRRRGGIDSRRIVLFTAGAVVLTLLLVTSLAPRTTAPQPRGTGVGNELRAFRAATGSFAVPVNGQAAGQATADFQRAEAAAREAGAPLAYTLWVEQGELETRAWRDLLQVGRFPLARPPVIDFAREVAVLVWPVRGVASEGVLRANGLAAESMTMQHLALELRVTVDNGGPVPATPAGTSGVLPYGLFTIPRSQWPLPAPPPTEPPLIVTLAR